MGQHGGAHCGHCIVVAWPPSNGLEAPGAFLPCNLPPLPLHSTSRTRHQTNQDLSGCRQQNCRELLDNHQRKRLQCDLLSLPSPRCGPPGGTRAQPRRRWKAPVHVWHCRLPAPPHRPHPALTLPALPSQHAPLILFPCRRQQEDPGLLRQGRHRRLRKQPPRQVQPR